MILLTDSIWGTKYFNPIRYIMYNCSVRTWYRLGTDLVWT